MELNWNIDSLLAVVSISWFDNLDSCSDNWKSSIELVQSSKLPINKEEELKDDLDECSSFYEETLSNDDISDNGIDNSNNRYKLNVISTNNVFETAKVIFTRANTHQEPIATKFEFKRSDSVIEKIQGSEQLDVISGKEMALNYLRRNLKSPPSYLRINSMVTNTNSTKDFKNDLISCLNVPEQFKRKQKKKALIFRSQSMPKSKINQSISERKNWYFLLFLFKPISSLKWTSDIVF